MQIGLLGAFLGGVLTLLSPCSVMLLPAFFSYAFADQRRLVIRTGIFTLGLITTLLPLGVLAGTLGAFVNEHRFTLIRAAAIIVILLGIIMLLNIPLPFLRSGSAVEDTSSASVYALGTVYGLAGVCAGPLLGAVLTVAAVSGSALHGGAVLLLFAAGMALPLLLLALLWRRLPFVQRLVRPREVRIGRWRSTWTGIIGGALTIALGILLLVTDGTSALSGLLGASEQIRLEGWMHRATSEVPDALVLILVLAGAGLALLAIRLRRKRSERSSEAVAPGGGEAGRTPRQ